MRRVTPTVAAMLGVNLPTSEPNLPGRCISATSDYNQIMETTSITEFLRDPKGVIRKLDKASDVIIERRDAAPLRLTLSSRAEADREGTAMLAHVLMKVLPDLAEQVWEPLVEVYAWLRFLPEQERPTFLREFTEMVAACAALGNNAPLAQLLHEWKATAAIYADPTLTVALKRPSSGAGAKVPRPKLVRR